MKWKDKLINEISIVFKSDPFWSDILRTTLDYSDRNIHLAIFTEPYLTFILKGTKKVESRFSINNVTPFGKVKEGDIVILKKSGGDIPGAFIAGEVKYIAGLNKTKLAIIQRDYGELICSDAEATFWEDRANAEYLTLISVGKIITFKPIVSEKNDRAGWSVIRKSLNHTLFEKKSDEK